jgi:hypothetical protein
MLFYVEYSLLFVCDIWYSAVECEKFGFEEGYAAV